MAQDDADSHGSGKKPGTPVPVERHCPVEATVDIIGGKYKSLILYKLITGTLRFSQLRRAIPCATPKMLTQQLRELERDGLVRREVFPVVPPKVEYSLSGRGRSLMKVLDQLCLWGEKNRPQGRSERAGV